MVIKALHHAGGVDYLARQAEKNPVAFMGLVGRVLPLQVTGEAGGPVHITFEWAPATPVDTSVNTTQTIEATATDLEIEWDKPDEC